MPLPVTRRLHTVPRPNRETFKGLLGSLAILLPMILAMPLNARVCG